MEKRGPNDWERRPRRRELKMTPELSDWKLIPFTEICKLKLRLVFAERDKISFRHDLC